MKLKHPDSGVTVETDAAHADMYLSQGWQKAAASKSTAARASGKKGGTAPRTTTKENTNG